MSSKPIFVATHPRACSTAFERVFMTRDDLKCIHEPFGDAFYFGPERLSARYEANESERIQSGFSRSTYKTIIDRLEREGKEGKRLFIKDITHYLAPPNSKPASIAPSLVRIKHGDVGTTETLTNNALKGDRSSPYPYRTETEPGNPTVIPREILESFHFTFLIRHPRFSVPSYYRCTIPPLDEVTGFYDFMPSEAGYDELRRVFDYLRSINSIGPKVAGKEYDVVGNDSNDTTNGVSDGESGKIDICVVDADDLLENPSGMIEAYCNSAGIDYHPNMLKWDSEEDHRVARDAFEKWKGFHEDAINSTELRKRIHKKARSDQDEDSEWLERFGEKGAKVIRETVEANLKDYEYLKQFALKV